MIYDFIKSLVKYIIEKEICKCDVDIKKKKGK